MTSKKKTTKKKAATKARPKASALSREQKLAVIEEAITRVPLSQSADHYFGTKSWPTFFRPATTWELMQFAEWWTRQGLDEVMQFAEVRTATDYVWLLRWNYSTGQPAGELQIEHGTAVETPSWCKFGMRQFGGTAYNLIDYPDTFEAIWEALKCLRDWRQVLSASPDKTTNSTTKEKKRRPFVRCLEHHNEETKLLAAALNGRPLGKSRLEFTKEFMAAHRKVKITSKQARSILNTMDRHEQREKK